MDININLCYLIAQNGPPNIIEFAVRHQARSMSFTTSLMSDLSGTLFTLYIYTS